MSDMIDRIETFIVTIPRDMPYLGPLKPGEMVNERGYLVRKANRTIYPTQDRSVLVKVTTASGAVGWGETYGLTAPKVIGALVEDLIEPLLRGRDPRDVQVIWEDLYDILRVRGYQGGFWLDALAAVDIALWDLCGKLAGLPLRKLLGGERRSSIPAYVSGLPRATITEKVELAQQFVAQGFNAIKIAAAVSGDGIEAELAALREALGPAVKLFIDFHWMFTAGEAASLIRQLERYDLGFAEAPCRSEDVTGLAAVAAQVAVPVAAGEEWRTVYDALPRLSARAISIIQPEMGHTGITQFMRMAQMAQAFHVRTMPHATIGAGIFMAASLQASAAILELPFHEYQHSIYDRNARFVTGQPACRAGAFDLPQGPGLGVEPSDELWRHAVKV